MTGRTRNASTAADGPSSSSTQDQTFDSKSQVELNRIDFQEKIGQLKGKMEEFSQKLRNTSKILENLDDYRSESINGKSAVSSVASMAASTSDVLSETFENLSLADLYLTQLENLFDFLRRQYERHLENVRRNFASVDAELRVWLDKCRVGPRRRSHFEVVCDVRSFDEQAFARYAAEIRKWATYYTSRSSIFEALNAFEESLNEKAALVVQSSDPARLANRACILLKEEIKRRCLEKEIASKREILKEKVDQFQEQHNVNRSFEINDYPLIPKLETFEREYLSGKIAEIQELNQQHHQIRQLSHHIDKNTKTAPLPSCAANCDATEERNGRNPEMMTRNKSRKIFTKSMKNRTCSIHGSTCQKPSFDCQGDFARRSVGTFNNKSSRHFASANSNLATMAVLENNRHPMSNVFCDQTCWVENRARKNNEHPTSLKSYNKSKMDAVDGRWPITSRTDGHYENKVFGHSKPHLRKISTSVQQLNSGNSRK